MSPKPKFRLELSINDLSNIPQVSGACYIELSIRDSKRIKSLPFKGLSILNGSAGTTTSDSERDESDDKRTPTTSKADSSSVVTHLSSSGGNISFTTSHRKIQNFECPINIDVSCNLKFGLKRRENLIADKYLMMRIFYVGEKHKEFGIHNAGSNRLELGRLEINLAEYLNFNEPITSKYLLKDSKINAILSTTIFLSELPANQEFHTQLQVSEGKRSQNHHHPHPHDTKLDRTKGSNATSAAKSDGSYNVPHFEGKNIFGGLNDVLGDRGDGLAKDKPDPPSDDGSKCHNTTKKLLHGLGHQSSNNQLLQVQDYALQLQLQSGDRQANPTSVDTSKHENNLYRNEQTILIDPIVNGLHKKILECTWDPKLHTMLDFTPEVCVESIFDGSIDELRLRLKEELYDDDDDDDEVRGIQGLVNECNYREHLRSWSINEVK